MSDATLGTEVETLKQERDQYKKLYTDMLAHCRKLELGIMGQKSERFISNEAQLTLSVLGSVVQPPAAAEETEVEKHKRQKPTGRKPLPAHLPRVDIEVLPPEVEAQGREAFEKISEDITETIEHRPASTVVVCTHRPRFVAKNKAETETSATVMQAPQELPIPRGLAGPAFLADTVVKRWQDHQPLHRQERIYGREGLDIARSTICGWHSQLMALVTPLLDAMWEDALAAPYLCTDATGVLVQALEKCRNAHFFVVAAPEKHVLFFYSQKHNSAAVNQVLSDYHGYLVADAHSVYDHLYKSGEIIEVGCWAHCLDAAVIPSPGAFSRNAPSLSALADHATRDNVGVQSEERKVRSLGDGRHRAAGCLSSPARFQKAPSALRFKSKFAVR